MPRAKGARTGQKHQRALAALSSGNGANKQPRGAAIEVAATDSEAVATSHSDDDDFKTFQVVSRFIETLVKQLENDEQKIEHARLWHEARKASAISHVPKLLSAGARSILCLMRNAMSRSD